MVSASLSVSYRTHWFLRSTRYFNDHLGPFSLCSVRLTLTITTNNSGWWRPYHDPLSNLPVTPATTFTFLLATRTANSFQYHFSSRSINFLVIVLHVLLVLVIFPLEKIFYLLSLNMLVQNWFSFLSDQIIIKAIIIIACPFPLDIFDTVFPLNIEPQHVLSKGLVISLLK